MQVYRDYISRSDRRAAVVAHRGAWRDAPENSEAAIVSAIDGGFDIAEVDVRMSRDGVLFLMHDDTMERMAGRAERAEALDMADLAACRLRLRNGGAANPFTDHTIPTLADILAIAENRIYLDLDVKYPAILDATAALVARGGLAGCAAIKTGVQSDEDAENLSALERRHGVTVMPQTFLKDGEAGRVADLLARLQAPVAEIKFDRLETLAAQKARLADGGVSVWVNTLDGVACCGLDDTLALKDPDASWGVLLDAGASVIQTDEPEALVAYLSSRPET